MWQEVVIKGAGQPGTDEVKAATWIKKHVNTNKQLVHALRQDLDAGEAEAIGMASEVKAGVLPGVAGVLPGVASTCSP